VNPALSELGVTEFLALARIGFVPRGLVIGSCVFSAGSQYDWVVATREITSLSDAMRAARHSAIARMRKQAEQLGADGVVDVRLEVEHHLWRGARQVAKCIAVGTAVVFDREHAPAALRSAPSLRLSNGAPFDSDLAGGDFVTLLAAGYRPVTVAMGNCVYASIHASCGAIAATTPRSTRTPRRSEVRASSPWSGCRTICSGTSRANIPTPRPASSG
jgi:uncharacterized protein YbjQ (UPF0145 family)